MSLERVEPQGLAPARGFTHAVRATGTTVHLAGQTALDGTGAIVGSTIIEQFEQALSNILHALEAAGGAPSDLASMTIYVTDIVGYRAKASDIGAIWRRLVGREYPAVACVEVRRLWDEAALVEIQGVAVLPPASSEGTDADV